MHETKPLDPGIAVALSAERDYVMQPPASETLPFIEGVPAWITALWPSIRRFVEKAGLDFTAANLPQIIVIAEGWHWWGFSSFKAVTLAALYAIKEKIDMLDTLLTVKA